jgi:hypothetical protein
MYENESVSLLAIARVVLMEKITQLKFLNRIRRIPKKRLAMFAGVIVAVILVLSFIVLQSPPTTTIPTSDYPFFVAPNVGRIESVRDWLMQPYNPAIRDSFGYDNATGLIAGGYWPGYSPYSDGYHNGAVLIDTNLLLGKSLDYLNAQKGIITTIDANTREWLDNSTFVDPANPGINATYQGNDRREILFGKIVPCVYVTASQIWYAPNHTLSDPTPIVTALPTNCSQDTPNSLELFAPWIDLDYVDGNRSQSLSDFMYTIINWTPVPGTGVAGSIGGHFNSVLDPAEPCSTERVLALWIEAARATGYWNLNSNTRTVAGEVVNELWGLQQPDGGMAASGGAPGCKIGQVIPEAGGEAILAFDPRVPSWFGNVSTSATVTQPTQSVIPWINTAEPKVSLLNYQNLA